jgi:hypothetical protein
MFARRDEDLCNKDFRGARSMIWELYWAYTDVFWMLLGRLFCDRIEHFGRPFTGIDQASRLAVEDRGS